MKFSCERCQTRYSIGDDKVKGKVLKIRCKTCGNIIVVREQMPTAQAEASGVAVAQVAAAGGGSTTGTAPSTPSTPSAPPPAPTTSGDHDWYVAIKGKQHGPAKHDDVVRLFRDGKITERTHLWHDKLPAWTRLKDLPEFASVVAEGTAPRRAPPPPPPDEGAEIVNFEAARAQRNQQQGLAPTTPLAQQPLGPVTNDPFAALQGTPGGGIDAAPRESTRVFIMQAGLHNRQKKQQMYAGIAVVGVLGFVLLCAIDYQLDLFGLKRVVDAVAEKTGITEAAPEAMAEWGDGEADPTLKCKLMPNPDECVKEVKAQQAKVRKKRALLADKGAPVSDTDLAGAFGNNVDTGGDIGRRGLEEAGGLIDLKTNTLSSDEIRKQLAGGKGGPKGPSVKIDTPVAGGGDNPAIDVENAMKVVKEGGGSIEVCVNSAMKNNEEIPSKIGLVLSIQSNGVVDGAKLDNKVVQAADFGKCLMSAGKKWKFPPMTEAAELTVPLHLQ